MKRLYAVMFLNLVFTALVGCAEPVHYIAVAAPVAAGPGVAILALPATVGAVVELRKIPNQEGSVFRSMCSHTCEGKSWYEDGCMVCSVLMTDVPSNR